jgi:outer membrane protein OmpA-like peptidoglycan-associated protein
MRRLLGVLLAAAVLAGCAQRQALFVVLPEAGGKVGAITVGDGKQSVVLDKAYAASELRGGAAKPAEVKPEEVQRVFAAAISGQPVLPQRFRLYFVANSDQLTPESETQYRAVFDDIKRRPVYQVEVIGYTDTVGNQDVNQRLSQQRAAAVRDRLRRDGIATGAISIAGRGKLDPDVKTADQVDEPRNRRVVITVR